MARDKKNANELEDAARERFSQIAEPDIPFEEFVTIQRGEAHRQQQLAANATVPYQRGLPSMTPCGGGDFEKGVDPTEWQGAYGTLPLPVAGDPFAGFTGGLFPGGLTDSSGGVGTAHQTAVTGPGTDPIAGISLTAPGSTGAVRIGNAVNQYGCELLSKTFTVPAARKIVKFWYALVLQDPGHDPSIQPYFWVRVTDAAGAVIAGAVNLGNGSDKAVASSSDPFFQSTSGSQGKVVYKDWTCAQINLSSHVGKTVTVEFVTADCGAGGHWGYAYLDNFCGSCAGSPAGDFNFDAAGSTDCGEGRLCFDYSLPTARLPTGQIGTGTVEIKLEILQKGAVAATLASPVLGSGTSYCFDIDPAAIGGLDPALEGFDFVATADFQFPGATLAPMSVGGAPEGLRPGLDNDYRLQCKAFSYAVKFVCGSQGACDCACGPVLPGRYATEINIYNHGAEPADVVKYVIPVVHAGAAVGREPRTVKARAEDRIVLPPYSATMDDCCRLAELLLGAPVQGRAPLSIGFLEIVSPVELTVTAVYTASGPDGGPVGIEVEQIAAKPRRAPPRGAQRPDPDACRCKGQETGSPEENPLQGSQHWDAY